MNNFELNRAIAEALGLTIHHKQYNQDSVVIWGDEFNSGWVDAYPIDYCGDWSVLMPLVVEHKKEMLKYQFYGNNIMPVSEWVALSSLFDENPQRALAECLLKVLQTHDE